MLASIGVHITIDCNKFRKMYKFVLSESNLTDSNLSMIA